MYVPHMPRDLPKLRQRIVQAVDAVDRQMFQRVWQELYYKFDICRVTKGGHIEYLKGRTETWGVSPSVDMLRFCVTILATVRQRSEFPEVLMNDPVNLKAKFGKILCFIKLMLTINIFHLLQ